MLTEKPWKLEAVLRLFLGVMTTFCLGAFLGSLAGHFMTGLPKAQNNFLQLAVSAFFMEIPALVWIGFFLRQHGIGWKDAFGWNLCSPATAAAYGVLVAAPFVMVAWGLQWVSSAAMTFLHLEPQAQAVVQQMQDPSMTLGEKIFMGAVAMVFAPLVEEMLFRGILYPAVKQFGGRRWALWASSVAFALVHYNMVTFLPLLVFALLLVYLYETFQNLLAPMVAHSLFNAANFVVLLFQDKIDRLLHFQ